MPELSLSARRTAVIVLLLLATLVFLVPASERRLVQAAYHTEVGPSVGPDVPVNRTTSLLDAGVAPQPPAMRDAYFAPAPGIEPPNLSARAYAVVERGCGAMVLGNDAYDRLPPASTTKIITALVVLLHADPNAMVNVDIDYHHPYFHDSSLMGLEPGMKLTVRDLLYGLMLPSGNDAAEMLARYVGKGDVGAFVRMMNETMEGWGMQDSRFANPSGLDQEGLYSTAWDLAQLGRIALDNPLLMDISTTQSYKPRGWTGAALKNGNALLRSYPGAFGLKIGFTDNARQTIVAAAERDGRQLVVSVLGSGDRYGDTRALLDWAFANTPRAC